MWNLICHADDLALKWAHVMEKLMGTMFSEADAMYTIGRNTRCCGAQHQRIGAYIGLLRAIGGAFPFTVHPSKNVLQMLEMQFWSRRPHTELSAVKKCKKKCPFCEVDWIQQLRDLVKSLKGTIGYMCLQCVRDDDFKFYTKTHGHSEK